MNQTAHISLQISNFQTALRQKKLRCALSSWRAPPLVPRIFPPYRTKPPRLRFRPPRLAPRWCISAPPVWGVLRLVAQTRNPFFAVLCSFCKTIKKPLYYNVLGAFLIGQNSPPDPTRQRVMLTQPVIHRAERPKQRFRGVNQRPRRRIRVTYPGKNLCRIRLRGNR